MSFMIELLKMPMPPTLNKAYATFKRGGSVRRVPSKYLTAYKAKFLFWSMRNPDTRNIGGERILELKLKFYFQHQDLYTKKNEVKRLDVTNRIKIIEDQLAQHIGIDDRYFFKVTAEKILGDHQYVNAEITEYEPS